MDLDFFNTIAPAIAGAISQLLELLKSIPWLTIAYAIVSLTILLIISFLFYALNNKNKYKGVNNISSPTEFEKKIKEFGWDKTSKSANKTKVVARKKFDKSKIFLENSILLNFIDKYFDLYKIDSELYTLNIEQVKGKEHASLNQQLRNILEHKGLYDFEINSYIINGNDSTRLLVADEIKEKGFLNP